MRNSDYFIGVSIRRQLQIAILLGGFGAVELWVASQTPHPRELGLIAVIIAIPCWYFAVKALLVAIQASYARYRAMFTLRG